jgi:sugar O-acyltransferase (sialic acid O-acetyltransferase NeuD family)
VSKLIIWGASGHGKVVLDVVRAQGDFTDVVFIDDDARRLSGEFKGCRVAGARTELASLRTSGYSHFVVAIGSNATRAECFQAAFRIGIKPATLVHPTAAVSRWAAIDPGTVVMPNSVINADSVIGANCIINSGAMVEHDCRIADHAHLAPGVVLGGGVRVGAYSFIGLNASVLPEIEVGERAIVGAGTVVLANVALGDTVAGVPARSIQRRATSIR